MTIRGHLLRACCLFWCMAAPLAAWAEGRGSVELTIRNAFLLKADGTPYLLPLNFDRYPHSGYVLTQHGPERRLAFTDGYETWNEGYCDGACGNFPPEDNHVGRGGYVHTSTYGIMRLARPDPSFSYLRADAARDQLGDSNAAVSINNTFTFEADSAEALTFSFDATPYANLFLAMASPAGSTASAEMRVRMLIRDLSTGELIGQSGLDRFNQIFQMAEHASGATFKIHSPGTQRLTLQLNPLTPGHTYQLALEQHIATSLLLPVPEPQAAHLYLAGLASLVLLRPRRRDRAAAQRLRH